MPVPWLPCDSGFGRARERIGVVRERSRGRRRKEVSGMVVVGVLELCLLEVEWCGVLDEE